MGGTPRLKRGGGTSLRGKGPALTVSTATPNRTDVTFRASRLEASCSPAALPRTKAHRYVCVCVHVRMYFVTNEIGTSQPQLEHLIINSETCNIKYVLLETQFTEFLGVRGSYSIGDFVPSQHCAPFSWAPGSAGPSRPSTPPSRWTWCTCR